MMRMKTIGRAMAWSAGAVMLGTGDTITLP